jgi:hypothetical protein
VLGITIQSISPGSVESTGAVIETVPARKCGSLWRGYEV